MNRKELIENTRQIEDTLQTIKIGLINRTTKEYTNKEATQDITELANDIKKSIEEDEKNAKRK